MNNEETKIPLFRRCVLQNFPFIEQDFDALTDYELLCKVVEYLNKVIEQTNINSEQVSLLTTLFEQLKSFVENYFTNLDVQEEINNKLDDMVEQGTLQEIITQYIQANVAWCFDTVEDMVSAENYVNGSYAQTYGFYSVNDGGGAKYKIRTITNDDVIDNMFIFAITNDPTLVAELIVEDDIHTKQIGLKGDGTTDDTTKLNTFFDKTLNCNKRVVDNGIYKITNTVYIKGLWRQDSGNNGQKRVVFDNATLLYDGNADEASVVLYNMFKYDVDGLSIARNSASNYVEIVGCWHLNYHDWDIQDLHIDNSILNLEGKTYSTISCMYIAGNAIYVKGTLTIGVTSGSFNNVISFYNSVFNGTGKITCVKLLGATSKQNIQFISCDLSYASASVYDVDEAQTGGCSITAIGCYYDSGISVFKDNDKKGVLYTNISSMSAANTNNEKQNIDFTDFNKNAVISNISPFGNNLPLGNVNYAINGDLSYNAGSQSGNYSYLMGEPSASWSKSYVNSNKTINGKARKITVSTAGAGDREIDIKCVTAPRTDKYCAFVHFKVVAGSFDSLQFNFKGQYLNISSSDIGSKECLIINNKGQVSVAEDGSLDYALVFKGASADLSIEFYEVGVTAGNTYIPNMPLDSGAKLS